MLKLPGDWRELVDAATGKVFFFSKEAHATTWERPGLDASLDDWRVFTDPTTDASYWYSEARNETSLLRPAVQPLADPRAWEQRFSSEGVPYYFNAVSLESTWTQPAGWEPLAADGGGGGAGGDAGASGGGDGGDGDLGTPSVDASGVPRVSSPPPLPVALPSLAAAEEQAARAVADRAARVAAEEQARRERRRNHAGVLWKRGGGMSLFGSKAYRKRWVTIDGSLMTYYKSEAVRVRQFARACLRVYLSVWQCARVLAPYGGRGGVVVRGA